nr:MAG TPA: hypothetical protein [Caudoviricetes sp.]
MASDGEHKTINELKQRLPRSRLERVKQRAEKATACYIPEPCGVKGQDPLSSCKGRNPCREKTNALPLPKEAKSGKVHD